MSDDVTGEAAALAAPFEGFSSKPYPDPGGIWTIGYGSIWDWRLVPIARVTAATAPIDEPTGRAWLAREMTQAAEAVAREVHVPLTDNMRAALDDFVFNVGAGNLAASTLLRLLNAGDDAGAAAEFDKWDHAGGRELAGLLRRRQAETDLFLRPSPA